MFLDDASETQNENAVDTETKDENAVATNENTEEQKGDEDGSVEYDFVGEDTELLDIMVSHEQYMNNLTIAMIMAEHKAVVEENKDIYEEARKGFILREDAETQSFWKKVVAFFKAKVARVLKTASYRAKWVAENKANLLAFDGDVSMKMPQNFKNWSSTKEINHLSKLVSIDVMKDPNEARKEFNKKLTGKDEENVNYAKYYADKIGDRVEVRLDKAVVKKAVELIELEKPSQELIGGLIQLVNKARADLKKEHKRAGKVVRSAILSAFTGLFSTIVGMHNVAWVVCRKAAKKSPKEEVKEEGYNDVLSQYLND